MLPKGNVDPLFLLEQLLWQLKGNDSALFLEAATFLHRVCLNSAPTFRFIAIIPDFMQIANLCSLEWPLLPLLRDLRANGKPNLSEIGFFLFRRALWRTAGTLLTVNKSTNDKPYCNGVMVNYLQLGGLE